VTLLKGGWASRRGKKRGGKGFVSQGFFHKKMKERKGNVDISSSVCFSPCPCQYRERGGGGGRRKWSPSPPFPFLSSSDFLFVI